MTWQCGRLNRTDEMVSRRPDPCGANARDEHCLNYTSGTCRQQTTRGVVRLCETRVSLSCSMTRSSSICVSLDTGSVLSTRPRRAGYSAQQRPLLSACSRPVMMLGLQFQMPASPGPAAPATRPFPDSAPFPGGMFLAGCEAGNVGLRCSSPTPLAVRGWMMVGDPYGTPHGTFARRGQVAHICVGSSWGVTFGMIWI